MIRIAFGQIQVHPGDPATNFQSMMQAIDYAKAVSTDILIFPELCLSGYMVGDLWDQVPFINDCLYYGDEIVKATTNTNLTIIFGNVGIDKNLRNLDGSLRKYNALYVASKGQLISNPSQPYPFTIKTLLPCYRYFNEPRYFTSANVVAKERHLSLSDINQPLTISTRQGDFTIAPVICEDSWDTHYPDCPTNLMLESAKAKGQHIDLIVNCSSSPYTVHKQEHRHALFSAQAKQYNTPIAYTNHVGIQNNGKNICIYDGCSALYDVNGSVVEEVPAFENTVRPTLLKDTLWQPLSHASNDSNNTYGTVPNYIPTLFKALQYGIRQFLAQTGIKKIVIGASGGIDSALNAALYSTVLAPENLYLVNMPSRYNSDMTKDLAYQLAQNIGCHYGVFPIEEGVNATIAQLEGQTFTKSPLKASGHVHKHTLADDATISNSTTDTICESQQTTTNHTEQTHVDTDLDTSTFLQLSTLAKENIQARDRSSRILAGIASAVNGAFTCNGNKTEFTVGYATMYGDLAGFLAVTGDVWKTDVYALARYMNEYIFKREVIPQGSIDVVPSAELSDAQDVAQGLGDPLQYEYHDCLFRAFVEGTPHTLPHQRLTPEDILCAYEKGTLEHLLGLPHPVSHYFTSTDQFINDLERWWKSFNGLAVAKRIQSPPLFLVSERAFGTDLSESQLKPYFSRTYHIIKERVLYHHTKK
ncbi:nitrilase-related carbon-nitrogen hydrolase [Veillonella sp. oral taxon 780]|uniref:nitrilase-related carbon-nitrogen hydrolase n=1 Tax=Veillonella sp. oral taxon 780 TaxID=671229 RepID=UPI00021A2EB2|nr:nitrilase-related carbon-nitrogen hydrolase [Veillonella sp. oral taxon 780]EGS34948.1 NAD synthase domain protein [Veillonella sp. oral taxon 780 str. F0422]